MLVENSMQLAYLYFWVYLFHNLCKVESWLIESIISLESRSRELVFLLVHVLTNAKDKYDKAQKPAKSYAEAKKRENEKDFYSGKRETKD